MQFTGTFTKTDTSETALNSFELEDTSSFVDEPKSTFSDRQVYLVKVDGTYVTAGSQTIQINGQEPIATITIDSVPADGYNITIALPVSMGGATLGSYTKQSSDTDTTILAESIATALGPSGQSIAVDVNVISIRFSVETGDYNGDDLVITSSDVAEVNAYALFNVNNLVGMPDGRVFSIQAQLPDDTYVEIGTYTKQVDDTTADIMGPRLVTAITGNVDGFVPTYSPSNLRTTAPSGYGDTINTKEFLISYSGGSVSSNFSNGVSKIGVIPNTITPFTGGVTEGTETVTGLDYFDWPFDSGDTIAIDILTEDIALSIMVVWVSLDPQSISTYSAVTVDDFVDYSELFLYNKVLQMAGNRALVSNDNFKSTLDITRTLIDSSATCIVFQDQYASQRCIENVSVIENNLNMFY